MRLPSISAVLYEDVAVAEHLAAAVFTFEFHDRTVDLLEAVAAVEHGHELREAWTAPLVLHHLVWLSEQAGLLVAVARVDPDDGRRPSAQALGLIGALPPAAPTPATSQLNFTGSVGRSPGAILSITGLPSGISLRPLAGRQP